MTYSIFALRRELGWSLLAERQFTIWCSGKRCESDLYYLPLLPSIFDDYNHDGSHCLARVAFVTMRDLELPPPECDTYALWPKTELSQDSKLSSRRQAQSDRNDCLSSREPTVSVPH